MDVHEIPMLEIGKSTGDCFTGMTNAIAYFFMREWDCERNAALGLMTRGTPLQHQLSKPLRMRCTRNRLSVFARKPGGS